MTEVTADAAAKVAQVQFPTPAPKGAVVPFKTFINKDRVRKLPESALKRPNYVSTSPWSIILPDGYTVEDMLKPSFWAHVARLFDPNVHNFIEVLNEERTIYARLYVRAIQEQQMVVENVTFPPDYKGKDKYFIFGPQPQSDDDRKLKAKWNVGKRGWDVVSATGQLVQDGKKFPVEEQANAWIDNHIKQIAT